MYFKTIPLPSGLNQSQAEALLRIVAIKETISLDFKFKAIDIGTDKMFYGMEGKKDLKFTRLQTSFEFFLPKLIISLPKDANFYRIRPGAISMAIIGFLSFALSLGIIVIIKGSTDIERLSPILLIILFYVAIFLLELRITQSRVLKALNNAPS
ncbi:MAG: hypothetical protein ACOH2V_07535 [Candidatus Saccharimonadaceae bacterium]